MPCYFTRMLNGMTRLDWWPAGGGHGGHEYRYRVPGCGWIVVGNMKRRNKA